MAFAARSRILPLARQTRFLSSSPLRASVIDSAKDTAKKVDRTVSDAAVKGIEKGGMTHLSFPIYLPLEQFHLSNPLRPVHKSLYELLQACSLQSCLMIFETSVYAKILIDEIEEATQKAKSTIGIKTDEAKGTTADLTGEAKGKAQELAGEAKGKANEVAGEAKGKKEEVKSKM